MIFKNQQHRLFSKDFLFENRRSLFFLLFFCWYTFQTSAQVKIIFDTDMGSDCDDAGAMAVLHKLADKGEAQILGVIFSSNRNKYGIGVCDAINTYYGRRDLPLGQYMGKEVGDSLDHYSKYMAQARYKYHHDVKDSTAGLLSTYKEILRQQPDSSVTIVTVGHPAGVSLLMKDRDGFALIEQKVKEWIAMAYSGEESLRDWNFGRNGAEYVVKDLLDKWPTDVFISGAGSDIITGNQKLPASGEGNPVKKAYELWNSALTEGRSSWDQIAVLFAVRRNYFEIDSNGSLRQTENMETYWDKELDRSNHYRVFPIKEKAFLEKTIESLMSEKPYQKNRCNG